MHREGRGEREAKFSVRPIDRSPLLYGMWSPIASSPPPPPASRPPHALTHDAHTVT